MKFSQRIGKSPMKTELEKEGLSNDLRNSLWTIVRELLIDNLSNELDYDVYGKAKKNTDLTIFFKDLWIHFFKYPIDNLPFYSSKVHKTNATNVVREWFFKADWFLIFDFIEFCSTYKNNFQEITNKFLKRELSAYRFVNGNLVEINSKEEIIEIENAINNLDEFRPVKEHLKRSIELYSDRKNPDYRNSIKESISAVEALSKILVNDPKTTLGQALKVIEKKHQIPNSLKSAFSALYGYTSGEGGIRHSLLEKDINIEIEEARFMLVTCSAFVNYLINKS
ncbi:hypothetical protein QVZ41_07255 [Wenyingzhuangia sp. chi5]|uniref:HEPN AbiJ-N-terminal domain-containing protein n=1 Tax=Wenyingzhuangia gilva TaxID=3057677 RepID=A0ABT8VRP3_9FLAO|nr:hypothetical protein [Wenyingzhuangia sp. chi5]MDO3694641.1 hypothetical protein [Wenyingzhuangia sp. chi5]